MICKIITEDDNTKSQGIIEIEGVHTLLSQTIATALDRTLLSLIPSYAPVYYTLNQLTNYQDSPSFREKFLEIRTNIESIRAKSNTDFTLEYNGQVVGQLLAKDLKVINGNVELLTPNQIILTSSSPEPIQVNLKIVFEKGVYYRTTEDMQINNNYIKSSNLVSDTESHTTSSNYIIPVNSVFNPVIKVKSHIVKDGVSINDNLVYEIQTDGRVTYLEALQQASSILAPTLQDISSQLSILSTTPVIKQQPDNSNDTFDRGDTHQQTYKKIRTLEDLKLTPQQYNFIKLQYKGLKDLSKDIEFNQLNNIYRLFNNNNVAYTEQELKEAFASLGLNLEVI